MTHPGRPTTRERLIDEALSQFADKGFYGASIADISDALGVTKQTLLHHFGSKEKLYAEVLQRIAEESQARFDQLRSSMDDPLELFERLMIERAEAGNSESGRVVMRELMDNLQRAERAGQWFLKGWLESLIDLVRAVPAASRWSREEALAFIYQILGAISYMAISEPTLRNMFGVRRYNAMVRAFPDQLRALIRARLAPR